MQRVRRSPRLLARVLEAVRQDVIANRPKYVDRPRSPWIEPRVSLARLADVMLPYRQFVPPPAAVSEEALARIMDQLEDDDREYPD